MNISVFGSGYVGLVTAACFAHIGHRVICVDVDRERVARLQRGEVPLHEPGLEDVVVAARRAGRLEFTTDAAVAVEHGELVFIAVGTPSRADGSADLRYVLQVARAIGAHVTADTIVVNKSTVPVGTAEHVKSVIDAALAERGRWQRVAVLSNPEFLKEGDAVRDFMNPDRIVIGGRDSRAIDTLRAAYAPLQLAAERILVMSARDAEFAKYAANTMLAARVSLMNEFANMADRMQVDIERVRRVVGSDPRIGSKFLHAGCGFGGSCFPKDVAALAHMAANVSYEAPLLEAIQVVNARQKQRLFEKISAHFGDELEGRVIAVWGLAFKPGTDDMREAPSRALIERLWRAGASVRAHDPAAMSEARRLYGERGDFLLCESAAAALDGADVLALVTEWPEYREPDFALLRERLRQPVVFDGRNVLDVQRAEAAGVTVQGIGRPARAQVLRPPAREAGAAALPLAGSA